MVQLFGFLSALLLLIIIVIGVKVHQYKRNTKLKLSYINEIEFSFSVTLSYFSHIVTNIITMVTTLIVIFCSYYLIENNILIYGIFNFIISFCVLILFLSYYTSIVDFILKQTSFYTPLIFIAIASVFILSNNLIIRLIICIFMSIVLIKTIYHIVFGFAHGCGTTLKQIFDNSDDVFWIISLISPVVAMYVITFIL